MRGSSLVAWTLATAFALRALIPVGYMLAPRAELLAGSPLMLCPAQHQGVLADKAESQHGHHGHHDADAASSADGAAAEHAPDSCPFALAAAPAVDAGKGAPAAMGFPVVVPTFAVASDLALATTLSLPPARGPPALS